MDVKHAKLSPSGAHRWMNCSGSVRMEEPFPDMPSEYAEEGTAAHEVAATCLINGIEIDHDQFPDKDMAEAVQVYLDYVFEHTGLDRKIEQRVNLAALNPPPGLDGGTVDCYNVQYVQGRPWMLHIIDYKHGAGVVVEAQDNVQLLYYALAVIATERIKPDRILCTIVQPRAYHPAGSIRTAEYTWGEMVAFTRDLFVAAERTLDPNAPLVPGDHCRFCKAQAVCPALEAQALEVAQSEFSAAAPEALTQEQLTRVLEIAPRVESWITAVRAHVFKLLEEGAEVPGWKLVPKRATRQWRDGEAAEKYLQRTVGLKAAAPRKLVSPAQAEKLLKKSGKTLPDSLVRKESSGANLAPADDPRPALSSTSAEDEFTAIPSGEKK